MPSPMICHLCAEQVLQDVVRSMFDTAFVDRLFTPQEVYSISNTRRIFEKLAHSSIMRLSESRCESRACMDHRGRKDTKMDNKNG